MSKGYFPATHTHNMPLELAYNYGIPVSLLLTGFVFFLITKTYIAVFRDKNAFSTLISKSLFASSFVIVIIHLSDVTYYEGKISILIWILLASLKCILEESKAFKN